MYQKAFDFVSGYHCLLFIPLIHAQWDLWKQIEILKKSPFRDQSDFATSAETLHSIKSLYLLCYFISRKTAWSNLPWLLPGLLPLWLSLGFQDVQTTCLRPDDLDFKFLALSQFSRHLALSTQPVPCILSFLITVYQSHIGWIFLLCLEKWGTS